METISQAGKKKGLLLSEEKDHIPMKRLRLFLRGADQKDRAGIV